MGYEAGVKAMLDAQINYDDVETGVACYCYGDTTSGQRIFYQFGMSTYVDYCKDDSMISGNIKTDENVVSRSITRTMLVQQARLVFISLAR